MRILDLVIHEVNRRVIGRYWTKMLIVRHTLIQK